MPMSYVFCDACEAGFHSNVLSCPDCGAPARRVQERHTKPSRAGSRSVREDVELEVRHALYGRRSGAVERLSGV
jgi:rRNA maturation endonuclease Nob1